MNIVAFTQASGFAKHCPWPQIALEPGCVGEDGWQLADVLLICPERLDDETHIAVDELVREAQGQKQPVLFATHKGLVHYRYCYSKANYVTHSKEMEDWPNFIYYVPLALEPGTSTVAPPPFDYIFIGGRKDRDFCMAYEAVQLLFDRIDLRKLKVLVVSDKLPGELGSTEHIIARDTPVALSVYRELMENALATLVPVIPGHHSHGHSDCVRSLQAATPVVVTKGASCDDYVEPGVNGVLVDFNAESMAIGLEYCINHIQYAHSYDRYDYRTYMQRIAWLAYKIVEEA